MSNLSTLIIINIGILLNKLILFWPELVYEVLETQRRNYVAEVDLEEKRHNRHGLMGMNFFGISFHGEQDKIGA